MPPFPYRITTTVATAPQSTDSVRLFHGGQEQGVFSIVNYGLSRQRAVEIGGTGEFWVTISHSGSPVFAEVAVGTGGPVTLAFDLPYIILDRCLNETPYSWVVPYEGEGWYEFLPMSYSILNETMTNITITYHQQ